MHKPFLMVSSVSAGLLLLWAPRQAAPPTIVSAYVIGQDLLFDSPVKLDWDSLVPANLRADALRADSGRRQRLFGERSDFGSTEVPFPVPFAPALKRRSYYYLDSAGIHPIRPSGFRAVARIIWTGEGDQIRAVQGYGQLRAAPRPGSSGGFVLIARHRLTLIIGPSRLSADSLLAPGGGTYEGRGTPFRQILRQYQIRQTAPSRDRWVWVQWLADTAMVEAGCTYRFSLFHLGPAPIQVSSTDTGCDV
jgi:hypothetical protein